MKDSVNICWFRRDLRLDDNAALYHALKGNLPVLALFIFDTNILDELDKSDARVEFIHLQIEKMHAALRKKGSGLKVIHGTPKQAFSMLEKEYHIERVFTNQDYENYAKQRDVEIAAQLLEKGITLLTYKDQVIFDGSEILKDDGSPYVVYTPYSRKWRQELDKFYTKSYPVDKYDDNFYRGETGKVPTLKELGFQKTGMEFPSSEIDNSVIKNYHKLRDYPSLEGTSRAGIHLRFGTISIRKLMMQALKNNDVYVKELVWREFYMMILWHYPHIGEGKAFKKEYDRIVWRNNEKEFALWCEGKTGYPMVDAGMRQLNATGYMHNRVRMVTASFLSKHLLIDWRWGEAYFAARLLDYEFASNNGGWQWAAGSGCDAAPYFRIFNPMLQAKKFDPKGEYIRKWVPEIEGFGYPSPIVEHDFARKRCLEVYGKAVGKEQ